MSTTITGKISWSEWLDEVSGNWVINGFHDILDAIDIERYEGKTVKITIEVINTEKNSDGQGCTCNSCTPTCTHCHKQSEQAEESDQDLPF